MEKKERHNIFINFKRFFLTSSILLITISWAQAQELKPIKLTAPDKKGGLPVMEAFALRASVRAWSDKAVSAKDLSDMLWAANGINRPDGKKTAASAMNSQDIDVYVFMKEGIYLYDAASHALNPVVGGDFRNQLGSPGGARPPAAAPAGGSPGAGASTGAPAGVRAGGSAPGGGSTAPILIFLVSDISRFRMGADDLKLQWGAIDAGIVSQNIALFCAAKGLSTRPRASFGEDQIRSLLKLTDSQHPLLNLPVGYSAE
ncbi:SagB/ThcOx family dehydrogenase [Deltaproteobacteria bacterium]|nr:SagB/ThcOx family dehydrogenase [Deltaproteobacteria bacterium]